MILPCSLPDHGFAHGLREQESSGEVRVHDLVPLLKRHFFDRGSPRNARIINKDVDAAEILQSRCHHFLNRCGIFHVAAEGEGLDTQAGQLVGRFLTALLLAGTQRNICSHLRQSFGHLATKPDGTTGDDGDAPGKVEQLPGIHDMESSWPEVSALHKVIVNITI